MAVPRGYPHRACRKAEQGSRRIARWTYVLKVTRSSASLHLRGYGNEPFAASPPRTPPRCLRARDGVRVPRAARGTAAHRHARCGDER
jgi:hypothetical protein